MKRLLIVLCFFVVFSFSLVAQEFNAKVILNVAQVSNPNLPIFKTLERSLTEFINKQKWTQKTYQEYQKIDCSFMITVQEYNNSDSEFSCSVQVQASREVYGSNYKTNLLNINDPQFSFRYQEYQPLQFDPNNHTNNLISTVSYYLYTILGLEADTLAQDSGDAYYQIAKNIVTNAQYSGKKGWNPQDGKTSRYNLNDNLLSPTFTGYRKAMYLYHHKGLDMMHKDLDQAKDAIIAALEALQEMNKTRPNSQILRVFFNAKVDELIAIFSGGPKVDKNKINSMLNAMVPTYTSNWQQIKWN